MDTIPEIFKRYNPKTGENGEYSRFLFRGGERDGRVDELPKDTIIVNCVSNGVLTMSYRLIGYLDGVNVLAPVDEIRQ